MYVLDEPSIGLHQRDNVRLIATLRRLRDLGNSVHGRRARRRDHRGGRPRGRLRPGRRAAGRARGRRRARPSEIAANTNSLTGQLPVGHRAHRGPAAAAQAARAVISCAGAREHNLRNVDVELPARRAGGGHRRVGRGKSSLINGILHPALRRKLLRRYEQVGPHDELAGIEQIDKVIDIDQKPIGRTPRSNPATYTKAFDLIRDVFAQTPEARAYGYEPGRFSFNVQGRALRGVRGRRRPQGRDALPARRAT